MQGVSVVEFLHVPGGDVPPNQRDERRSSGAIGRPEVGAPTSAVAKIKKNAPPESLSKTVVFEKEAPNLKRGVQKRVKRSNACQEPNASALRKPSRSAILNLE
jgi:hypothetical protein